ncbi:MAG: hypothetical protein J6J83_01085 [Oscillospiraceae bacterium]|nr:hypothetical protein [Oscillospiraceae bacterium]
MKKTIRVKHLALILSLVLILSIAVGGTIAYIAMKTNPVVNQFDGSYVTSRVNVSDDTIDVTNTGDVRAYIRAAILVNWESTSSKGVFSGSAPASSDYTLTLNLTDWHYDSATGFYYYKTAVDPLATTNDLVTDIAVNVTPPAGYSLCVEVVAEAIQADGDHDVTGENAYADAWDISLYG